MTKWIVLMCAAVCAAAALAASCSSSGNDCESYLQSLCSYASYKTDKDEESAKTRQQQCACITDGPDNLGSDYQKLLCTSDLEKTAALDPSIDSDAQQLLQCRVRASLLATYEDLYIKTCFQTDGKQACTDDRDSCDKGCSDSCKDTCAGGTDGGSPAAADTGCLTACQSDCGRKYPCDQMCG